MFAMIADKCQTLYQKTHQIQFAKIPFNANTQPIFEKYGVINVPVVKAISSNGKVY